MAWRATALVVAAFAPRAGAVLLHAHGDRSAEAAPLPGVFVALSGGDAEDLPAVTKLFADASPHRSPSSPVYLGALAFRETAACAGGFDGAANCTLYEDELAAWEPLFNATARVWLGLAEEPSPGDPLKRADGGQCESWLDGSWVAALAARYAAAARLLAARYAGDRFGLYVTHELFVEKLATGCRAQNGTWIASSAYGAAVAQGMGSVVAAARAEAPAWPIMWSPAATESAPMPNRTDMVAAASLLFDATRLDELHLQDSVGKGSSLAPNGTVQYMTGCEHAADLAAALAEAGPTRVAVNAELFLRQRANFSVGTYSTVVGDPEEHEDRRACYRSRGLDLGVSWEALWYYKSFYSTIAWAGAPRTGPGAGGICQ